MIIPHERFCVLPWVSIEASPIGTVRPCCLSRQEIVNDNNEKYLLGKDTLDTIRNSTHMQQLRSEFLAGKKPNDCNRCWSEESAGRTSKRMHTLVRLNKMLEDEIAWGEKANELSFIDLKLGNICNLKCRICGSWSSSSYATEEIKFTKQDERKSSFHYTMLLDGAWPRNNNTFWQDLYSNAEQIRYLEFTGGEPFMIKEHFDFLQYLVNLNLSDNIEIHYNTNGTIFPESTDVWKYFKRVEIAFSIDDINTRYEYQRSGAKWSDVNDNIEKFNKLAKESDNVISLQVCCTINVFNVYYLGDVAKWLESKLGYFDFVYWNMLHDGPEFCISNLPQNAKQAIASKLEVIEVNSTFKNEFKQVVEFMMQGKKNMRTELLAQIRKTDNRRNENLSNSHLELAYLIGYE